MERKLKLAAPPGGWPLTLQVSFAVLVTLAFSIWQFSKGFESQAERDEYINRLSDPPVELSEYREQNSDYTNLKFRGVFEPERTFFVAYQRHNQHPGFWVIMPFRTDRGSFLVNRGWVPLKETWLNIPEVDTPDGNIEITGIVWPQRRAINDQAYETTDWPKRVNRLDLEKMAELTNSFKDEIRLTYESEGVFVPIKLVMENSPARHWGYAFQWLLIGGLIVSGYWFFALRKEKDH